MKKLILIVSLIVCLIVCAGCKIFDLDDWVAPDDTIFMQLVSEQDTPKKICEYMETFEWNISLHTYSPYEMYLANLEDWNDTGDCDDFAAYGMYVANIHGYPTYRITMWAKFTGFYGLPLVLPHVMTVYIEDNKYTYSSNHLYFPIYADTFKEIIDDYEAWDYNMREIISWKVYDYNNNLMKGE